jgi:hypothetical protein
VHRRITPRRPNLASRTLPTHPISPASGSTNNFSPPQKSPNSRANPAHVPSPRREIAHNLPCQSAGGRFLALAAFPRPSARLERTGIGAHTLLRTSSGWGGCEEG